MIQKTSNQQANKMAPIKTVSVLTSQTLVIDPPEEQKFEKKGSGAVTKGKKKEIIKYYTSKLKVADEKDGACEFCFDLPIATCIDGITEREFENKTDYSIRLGFDQVSDPDNVTAMNNMFDSFDMLYQASIKHMFDNRVKLGLESDTTIDQIKVLVKNPMYIKSTGRSMYLKLGVFDNGKTPFFDLADNPIDWALLSNATFKCKCIVRFRQLYSNKQMTSIQMYVKQVTINSAIEPKKEHNAASTYTADFRAKNQEGYLQQQESLRVLKESLKAKPLVLAKKGSDQDLEDVDDDIMN